MTSTTIGSGAVDVVGGCVVVGVVDTDVAEATAGAVDGVVGGAADSGAAWLLGPIELRKINPAPIEEAAAAPNIASFRMKFRR